MTDVDVIVAGAGAAGLAAALAAEEQGATVALLEARENFRAGSNTAMSTSMVPAAGSRWQREAGVDDSPDVLFGDIMAKTGGEADPVVARALADVSAELGEWMADHCGVPLERPTDFRFPGHSVQRHLCVPDRAGRTLHAHLLEAVADRPAITLVIPARLVDVEEHDGGLTGVIESPDGRRERITGRAVILATNGFGADRDLVETHIPEIADGVYFGSQASTGDALRIGEGFGADTGFLDSYQGHASVTTPHGVLLTWTTVMNGGFVVNTEGRRFGDESHGYSEFAVPVLRQSGGVAWVVYDRRIHDLALKFADYLDVDAAGAVRWAADVDELAEIVDVPVEELRDTFARVDRYRSGEAEDPHGRTDWGEPLEPPYATAKVTGALFHTQGGLRVDGHGRVLSEGEPVPGLYAAGGAAAGISGHGAEGYLSGNGLLSALGLGYLAGRHAAGALTGT
ncbi:MAG: FAD-binding protein [Acidimicrobiia bacterium]|nr:FAD-binding protein [Acidimicrobiia bacterium]